VKNLIQLYFDNGKSVPFIVSRESWDCDFGLLVVAVKPKKGPSGWFGSVRGFGLPPLNGQDPNPYWGNPGEPIEVSCAGSYQWELLTQVPEAWQPYLGWGSEVRPVAPLADGRPLT